jgi:predicted dehydrogenase
MENLRKLGVQRLAACDPNPDRLKPIVEQLGVEGHTSLESALSATRPDVMFICTPPANHVQQALQAVRAGAHVFVEKPLSDRLDHTTELASEARSRKRLVQVGYNLRFHPGLLKLKQLLNEGAIGKVLWAYVEAGQYLPDWRPWQDYRQSYTARRQLGGGILLDGSHEIDYVLWLLGMPKEVLCMTGKVGSLDVDVEDCASVLLRMAGGCQVEIHLDFVQRGYSRNCKIAGEEGTLFWDFTTREVRLFSAETNGWQSFPYNFEPNDMYISEVQHFFNCIASGETPAVDLEQASAVLKTVAAAKASAEQRCGEILW